MNMLLSLSLAALAPALWAAQAPDFDVARSATASGSFELVATPPAGHHLNIKAPMEAEELSSGTKLKPKSAEDHKVVFAVGAGAYAVRLYLCDDANTYCERHDVHVYGTGTGGAKSHAPKAVVAAVAGPVKKGRELGFILNDPRAALAEAVRRKAPLLIDFYGIWCPPCNMLDENVFSKKEFQASGARFVRLKLDADSPVSWDLKSRFHVLGYPTVVFASADGDEISRIVGYRPADQFLEATEEAWRARAEPYAALKVKADGGDVVAAFKVGRTHLERGEFDLARQYLEKAAGHSETPEAAVLLLDAKVGLAESEPLEKFAEVLEAAVKAQPGALDAIDWRSKLADTDVMMGRDGWAREQLEALVKSVDDFVAHPEKLVGHDALPADLLEAAADAQEKISASLAARGAAGASGGPTGASGAGDPTGARGAGDPTGARGAGDPTGARGAGDNDPKVRTAWLRAADAYRAELVRSAGHAGELGERGFNLELAYCLGRAGDLAEAESIYSRLEKKFPREFTFYFNHARMLLGRKDAVRARELAMQAFRYSYGDNRLRAAELLAKAYAAENNVPEALKTVRDALGKAALPSDVTIRTVRYVDKLRALEKALSK